ncbi:MAG: ComF family protein [Parcubacteria group bacterium]|nr:ComF family protein [Parcubacteria group bacterium]
MQSIQDFLLELLFPAKCLNCSAKKGSENPQGFLCKTCRDQIPLYSWLFCPVCQQKLAGLERCPYHKSESKLRWLGVASDYQNPLVRELIWNFKYKFLESLKDPLGTLLADYIRKVLPENELQNFQLLPIPLHAKRERWRGFNQAGLLSRSLSKNLGLEVISGLSRPLERKPQMEISSRKARFQNVEGIFKARSDANFEKKNIILIDDVVTSGATLEEAARTLKKAGAKNVAALVVARG